MSGLANRIVNRLSDLTVGTVIVLVHVALANREVDRPDRPDDPNRPNRPTWRTGSDGARAWRPQISP